MGQALASRVAGGYTLAETLVVVSLLAVMAAVALPSLGTLDLQRLDVAAAEVRNALRLARSEAMRLNTNVLVDMGSAAGHVKLYKGSCGASSTAIIDPRSKRAFDVDVAGGPYSGGVTLTPQFMAAGTAYNGLVFASSGVPTDVCQLPAAASQGAPQAGSQVLLSYGGSQLAVAIAPATGRVWGP
ncbi:MAG: GspH/FimT family pseudopilin [Burkholderiales bacterium]|nr:GspH/FimT family pseudopilin [Burkholderiales bacterium]